MSQWISTTRKLNNHYQSGNKSDWTTMTGNTVNINSNIYTGSVASGYRPAGTISDVYNLTKTGTITAIQYNLIFDTNPYMYDNLVRYVYITLYKQGSSSSSYTRIARYVWYPDFSGSYTSTTVEKQFDPEASVISEFTGNTIHGALISAGATGTVLTLETENTVAPSDVIVRIQCTTYIEGYKVSETRDDLITAHTIIRYK